MFTHFSTSCSLNKIFINKKTVERWYRLNIKINKTCNHFYVNDIYFIQQKVMQQIRMQLLFIQIILEI